MDQVGSPYSKRSADGDCGRKSEEGDWGAEDEERLFDEVLVGLCYLVAHCHHLPLFTCLYYVLDWFFSVFMFNRLCLDF
jgi:hypothetical protein